MTVCSEPGCPNLTDQGKCPDCHAEARRASDQRRPNARARGYDHRWARTRRAYLRAHPTCECDDCTQLPAAERPASVDVDHRDGLGPTGPQGHDHSNLRAMAHAHHSQRTARDQPGGWNAR